MVEKQASIPPPRGMGSCMNLLLQNIFPWRVPTGGAIGRECFTLGPNPGGPG